MSVEKLPFEVKVYPARDGKKNCLAEVELEFTIYPFQKLKLVGFSVWTNDKDELNVTVPARPYHARRLNKEAHYQLLRTIGPFESQSYEALENVILDAYEEWDSKRSLEVTQQVHV